MKFNKQSMVIKVQVADVDSIPALLGELTVQLNQESIAGTLRKTDGDEISWELTQELVQG